MLFQALLVVGRGQYQPPIAPRPRFSRCQLLEPPPGPCHVAHSCLLLTVVCFFQEVGSLREGHTITLSCNVTKNPSSSPSSHVHQEGVSVKEHIACHISKQRMLQPSSHHTTAIPPSHYSHPTITLQPSQRRAPGGGELRMETGCLLSRHQPLQPFLSIAPWGDSG